MSLPDLPEIAGFHVSETRSPVSRQDLRLRRLVANELELWEICPRVHCRRAGGCRNRAVACFDEQRRLVVAVMTEFLYAGYSDEDGIGH